MESLGASGLWLEALSHKLVHRLPVQALQHLFDGEGRQDIRFRQRLACLVHVESGPARAPHVAREVQALAEAHGAVLAPYPSGAVLAVAELPSVALDLALALQRMPGELHMRIGIVQGLCVFASFEAGDGPQWTVVGPCTHQAQLLAAHGLPGSTVVAAQAYRHAEPALRAARRACIVTREYYGEELAHATITLAPSLAAAAGLVDLDLAA